jgi:uncharacterized protein (DUF302 family)
MENIMNKQVAIAGFGGLVAGLIIMAIVGFYSLPGMMMQEDQSRYDDFDTTVEQFEQKVREAGWSVLTVHDMQATLQGHGHDVKSVKIFELCSARYSAEILKLDEERIVSPLMPCRVAIYEKSDGNTYISRMDSELMARPFGGVIKDVMQVAAVEIENVIQQVIR